MLNLTQTIRLWVVWGGLDLLDAQQFAHRRHHSHELFTSVRQNEFWDSVKMEPVPA